MAQKNILKYIILGLLAQQELAGYDIKKLFEGELGDFWYSNHSQIYPELQRMGYPTMPLPKFIRLIYSVPPLSHSLQSLPGGPEPFHWEPFYSQAQLRYKACIHLAVGASAGGQRPYHCQIQN